MKFVELSQHLHELRAKRTGRPVGAAMRVNEVWQCAIDSPHSTISEVLYKESPLPRPFDGVFVRLVSEVEGVEKALILISKDLPKHWREFVATKETMHCWSPGESYVPPQDVRGLVEAHCAKEARYTPSVIADNDAILAAAEVMLPHYTVERHFGYGHDADQIAASHGMHPDIVREICRMDILHARKNGSFN
jgi:hypothetical protein